MYERAKCADELLADMEPGPNVAVEYYRTFYAAESLMSAHAGWESFKAYVIEDTEGAKRSFASRIPMGLTTRVCTLGSFSPFC